MHLLISVLGILITILFVVGTHESAHFMMARALGIKVLRFSIGFGKTLWHGHDKSGTEYVIALIPLGGYVKMLDEGEGEVTPAELPYAFNRQPFYKKFLVVLAGPAMNIFCALVLYWIIFMIGFVTIKPLTGVIKPRSIAAESGLQPHQEIISVDGTPTSTWTGIMLRLVAHAGDQDQVKIATRDLQTQQITQHVLDLSNWHMDKLTPDPLSSLGITPFEPDVPLVIGVMAANSPAQSSALKIGDKILAINTIKVANWDDLITKVIQHPSEKLNFLVERNKHLLTVPVNVGYQRDLFLQKSGFLGIGPNFKFPPEMLQNMQFKPLPALERSWQEISDFAYFNLLLFGKLVTGKLSLQSLGGPITIFQSAGDALNYSVLAFLGFLAFLSIAIGVVNLLPIPGLDGGHLFFQTLEFIFRRPVPEYWMTMFYRAGFLLIFFVLIQAIINDVLRLI